MKLTQPLGVTACLGRGEQGEQDSRNNRLRPEKFPPYSPVTAAQPPAKPEPSDSGSGLERRSSRVNELSALAGSERYEACSDDAGAYRFRRGR